MAQEGTPEGTSDRACDRCRERRVKCDKRLPTCLRCEKLGKPCLGYDKKRKFVDEGIILRKKYQNSHNRSQSFEKSGQQNDDASTAGASTDQAFFSPRTDFASPHVPAVNTVSSNKEFVFENQGIDISNAGTHINPSDPSLDTTDPLLFLDNGLSDAVPDYDFFSDPDIDPSWFDIQPDVFFGPLGHSCGFIPSAQQIVDEVDKFGVAQSTEVNTTTPLSFGAVPDTSVWAPEIQWHTSALITDEREHEMAYLIRHFTEAIGPWMDLFDQDKHFGSLVPLKALRDALLRNAIAAVAAKQLGRVKGTKSHIGVQCQRPATMEVMADVPVTDWFYKAANYYDKAIAFSREYLQTISGSLSNPSSPDTHMTTSFAKSDDLLVAVSIFSLYESLDNLEMSWLQHLAGFKTLLTTLSVDCQPQTHIPTLTIGRRASFWNFARADYQAAYINNQRTFLNTEDIPLWHSCGLQLQEDGTLYKDAISIKNDPSHCREVAETVSHTILWLLLRVMNFLASNQDVTADIREAQWQRLTKQLDGWFDHLPQTFQPCAQILYPMQTKPSQLMEVFFTMPVCAAALQLYHFARILLLLHRPLQASNDISASSPVLRALLASSAEALKHAHRIIGIALGRPPPAVRVEMLLPLYIAGVCLEDDEERRVLVELLRAIELDTGYSTADRCRELARRWEWNGMAAGVGAMDVSG